MPTKKQIITFGVLCVIALGLGYWSGMPEKDSGQRAGLVAPTVVTNVVTNVLKEVVTNIVRVPTQQPARQKAKRPPAQGLVGGLPPPEAGDRVGRKASYDPRVGTIASYDPKFNFYVVNRGAHHGIKTGDEYNVIRNGNIVGKIKIQKTDPTVSVAVAVKAFTPQRIKVRDEVIMTNIVVAPEPTLTPPPVIAKPQPSPTPNPIAPEDEKLIADAIVEKVVREILEKPEGELTEVDLAKVLYLSLPNTQITDAGLKEVAKLQNLEDLNLFNTKITDEGLKEVAKLKQLTYLSLYNTQVTDAGLKEVAKLQNLTTLNLGSSQITDEGLKEVAKLQNLRVLYLFNTIITDVGVAELKKALPNCSIEGT